MIREGRIDDCPELAKLINESAEGAIDYLFSDFDAISHAAESMSQLLEHEVYYSFANAIVVEFDKKVIGMALSFPADGLVISEQMKLHYTDEKLQYIRYFVENKIKQCWHLDALCIKEAYRNLGTGSKLIQAVKELKMENEKLKNATLNSLKLADENNLKSISFPAISAGIFGFPIESCAKIMLSTTIEYLKGQTNLQKARRTVTKTD